MGLDDLNDGPPEQVSAARCCRFPPDWFVASLEARTAGAIDGHAFHVPSLSFTMDAPAIIISG